MYDTCLSALFSIALLIAAVRKDRPVMTQSEMECRGDGVSLYWFSGNGTNGVAR